VALVGSASVEIVPDARGFREKLDAALKGITDITIGVTADTAAAKAKIDALVAARTVEIKFRTNGAPTGQQGTKAGSDYADAFSRIVQSKVEAALRSLPEVQIGVATTEAEQKLKDLQADLAKIRDGKVGVDFTSEEALAKIDEFRQRLDALGSQSPDVQVRTNTLAAIAELDKVRLKLDELNGKTVESTVRVRTEQTGDQTAGSSAGFSGGLLGAAVLPLAALAVPLGAATLGLGAGLAGGVAAGVAALGALKLGLSGVGTAVQAVQAQQASAGADAVSYGNAQASAAAGVQSAQNGLANAQRSAATAATSSARAITTAQQGVADAQRAASASVKTALASEAAARTAVVDAQRAATASVTTALASETSARTAVADATRSAAASVSSALVGQESAERSLENAQRSETNAQNTLTLARKSAQQQIEDLTNSVADGALAQRGAVLAVESASAQLQLTNANAFSTQLQRDQAQLAYDQAVQQTTDLKTRQDRLIAQKAAADKAGVDGATNVLAAQQALGNATQGVAVAQDALARANAAVTEAQRAGAESVQKSQDKLLQSTAAVTEARRAGAESVAKAEQSLAVSSAAVTEARRAGAESVAKAEQGVTAAQEASAASAASSAASITSAQEGVANALRQQAIAAAAVSSSAATAAAALAGLTPAAAVFAQFVVSTLEPALKRLKDAASSGFLPGLQQGITDLLPLMPVFTSIVSNVSTALGGLFTAAGAGLSGPFFTQFFGFLRDTAGPALSTLGTIIGNVVTGFAGLFQGFAPVIAQVGGGIAGLTGQFAAFATSLSTSNGFQSFLAYVVATGPLVASTFGDLFRLIGNLIEGLAPLGAVLLTVVDQVAKLLANLGPQGLLIAIAAVSAAVVGLGIAFGPISISVVAISTGITALAALFTNLYQTSQPFHDFIQNKLLPTLQAFGGFIKDDFLSALGRIKQAFEDNQPAIERLGQALGVVAEGVGLLAGALAVAGITGTIEAITGVFTVLADALTLVVQGIDDVATAAKKGVDALGTLGGPLASLSTVVDGFGGSTTIAGHAVADMSAATTNAKPAADALSTAQDGLKASQDKLSTALQGSIDKFTILNGGVLAHQAAADALTTANAALTTSVNTNGVSLDGNTTAGVANKAAIIGALTALNDKITADFKANESTQGYTSALETANQQTADGKAKLEALAGQLGLNKVQTDALVSSILKTPDQVKTEFSNNLTQAQADVAAFQATVDAIHGKDIKIGVQGYIQGGAGNEIIPGQGAIPKATGGYISGAGTGTSDSIPARLSNGEFVVKASETVKHLPMLHAMNNGQLPGFANGGFVPKAVVTLNGSDDFTPATSGIADFFKKLNPTNLLGLASVGSGGIGSSIPGAGGSVDRWAPQILQALALQGLPANFLAGVENVIAHESGGNPNAINLTDSNAVAGHPSQGLMQTIPSTFLGNAGPFASRGITDPLANIYAGIHYAMANYGAGFFANGGRSDSSGGYLGYDSGGYIPPGVSNIYNGTGKPEMVFTPEQLSKRDAQGGNGGAFTDQQVRQLVHAIGQVAPGVTDGLNGVARSAYAAQRG
jgi:hypothetical protein